MSLKMLKENAGRIKGWWNRQSTAEKLITSVGSVVIAIVVLTIFYKTSDRYNVNMPWEGSSSQPSNDPNSNDDDGGSGTKGAEESPSPVSSDFSIASGPARIINLKNWKLTLPVNTGYSGNPDEIKQPDLSRYNRSPYFRVTKAKNGVAFRAQAGGATTSGSGYPRSELREMSNNGKTKASWSSTRGVHTMTIRQAITHLPSAKPHVVAGQIHDAEDDIMMIRLERKHLFVEADGDEIGTLDSNYQLGKTFTVKIQAQDGKIRVFYNGKQKVVMNSRGSGYYFKAGCYTQSNPSRGDKSSAYGEVVIYRLSVSHKN